MKNQKGLALAVCPEGLGSKWVALDTDNNILEQGTTPEEVKEKLGSKFINSFLMFIPEKGVTYVC